MVIKRLPNRESPRSLPPVGRNIRRARTEAGLSQTELASIIGTMSTNSISSYETGIRKPDAFTVWRIARACSVPVECLYREEA